MENEVCSQTEEALSAPAGQEEKKKRPGGHPFKGGKRKKWLVIALAAAVLAVVVLRGCGGKPAAAQTTYTEEQAAYRAISQILSGSGTLAPANSYTVTTLLQGEILTAGFEEGDTVEKDTVLYEIDSSDSSTNVEKAELSLNQARRSYESALESKYLTAKTSGTVSGLQVSVGDQVSAGQTLATIRDSSTLSLKVHFPSDDAASFYVGQGAAVTLDGSFETLSGSISAISGSDEVLTGNRIVRQVTIQVANGGALTSTQSATASVNGVGSSDSGTLQYKSESVLTAPASGEVAAINVSEGGYASKGQTVLTLGGDTIDNQVQSASENVRNAEISLENTQDQMDDYTITSPIAGTIVDKQYKAGDKVESGKTLCTIYDLSYLEMTLNIDELDISLVEVGQKVQITADAVEGKSYEGVITKVSVAGTTTGGTTSYPVTIRIDETDGLLPGMNVDAEIIVAAADNALAIPGGAVERGNKVLITSASPSAANALEDAAPEGYVYVQVETGISDDDYIEILSGLQEGDTVAYIKAEAQYSDIYSMMMGGPVYTEGEAGGPPDGGGPEGGPQG
ncbi:HlyD family efflux transporter periplasmic adaptor subunit [Oscillibacter hominis]|uniref:HlyD family efflux transporter periplasmic adaptor subunit n=1 Tax=Oscillibacter hominis TaxID=2763056 RepID=A0A7G9B249_9FIRM|nr:HlyD family efflux transporter periplasmic adaptor subunit [Oscillibacter hominis]QNL43630.1 HlyD family efflux transporter periplasmic adaptor subunit [Oscillibacter hominis]